MCGMILKKKPISKGDIKIPLMKLDTEVLLAAKHLYRRITLPHVLA